MYCTNTSKPTIYVENCLVKYEPWPICLKAVRILWKRLVNQKIGQGAIFPDIFYSLPIINLSESSTFYIFNEFFRPLFTSIRQHIFMATSLHTLSDQLEKCKSVTRPLRCKTVIFCLYLATGSSIGVSNKKSKENATVMVGFWHYVHKHDHHFIDWISLK